MSRRASLFLAAGAVSALTGVVLSLFLDDFAAMVGAAMVGIVLGALAASR